MDFQTYQRSFTARIRDPKGRSRPPGAPAQRMKVYEDLLYNNMDGFLLGCFPVCRQILGVRRWTRLVRAFFRDHACHSPYFRQIPEEFLKYLQETGLPEEGGYPAFLPELAHYEWVELELDTSDKDRDLPAFDPAGDLLEGRPLLNPVLRVLAYRWPVHRLGPRYKPVEAPDAPTFLLAFRDADLTVRFNVINPATARLLTLMQERPGHIGRDLLEALGQELPGSNPATLIPFGAELLADLRDRGAVLGALR